VQAVEGRRDIGRVAGAAHYEQATAGQDDSLYEETDKFHPPALPRGRAHLPAGKILASGALCGGIGAPNTFDGRGKH
jgi:hypothetical protein